MSSVVNRSINIYVDSGQAEAAYNRLVKKEKELKDELAKATNPKVVQALNKELDKLSEPIDRARKKMSGELKPSITDLQATVKRLGDQLRRTSNNDANFDKLVMQVRQAKIELAEAQSKAAGLDKEVRSNSGGMINSLKGVGIATAGAFATTKVVDFGRAVLNTRAEFQKFEAVLTNTLGSNSIAKKALDDITAFASQTPFGVSELTDSFVKLANRGFVPTTAELRKLGDLAASTGKSFDQLAEALLDAQTGEFERLKEFGVRAKKNGDQVQLTFKGITTTVKNTEEAIRGYITALGDVEGISGSMAAISETLGGQISNLGDSWDQMLNTVGSSTEGIFGGAIKIINDAIQDVTAFIKQLDVISKFNLDENDGPFPFLSSLFGKNDSEKAADNIAQFQQGLDANFQDALAKLKEGKGAFAGYMDAIKDRLLQPALAQAAERGLEGEKRAILEAFNQFGKTISDQAARDITKAGTPKQKEPLSDADKKSREKVRDEFLKLQEELAAKYRELQFYDTPQLVKDLERIDQYYDKLEGRAKGNAATLKQIEELRLRETRLLVEAYQREEVARIAKLSKEQAEKQKQLDLKRLQEQAQFVNELAQNLAKKADEDLGEKSAESELKILQSNGRSKLQAIQEQLNLQEQIEIKAAEGKESKIALIQEQYRQKRREAEIQFNVQSIQDAIDFASGLIGALDGFFQLQTDRENRQLEADRKANDIKKKNYERQLDRKQISQQEFNKKIADDQAALDKKERELKIKQFNRDKAINIGKAIINTAQGVLQALSSFPPPISFIMAAIVGALGAVQIGQIASQKPPQFAKGGVLPGPSHAEGGMPIVNPSTGQKVAEVEGGEPILSKATYRNNKPLVDALLYSSMYQGGRKISAQAFQRDYVPMNISGIQSSQKRVRMFETGGILPTAPDNSQLEATISDMTQVLNNLSAQLDRGIPAYTLLSQNERAKNRMDAIRRAATIK